MSAIPSPGQTPEQPPAPSPQGLFLVERDFAGRQHVGTRNYQEDFYAFSATKDNGAKPPFMELLVALGDGLGAHLGGNVASFHVVDQFIKKFKAVNLPLSWRLRVALDAANDSLDRLAQRMGLNSPPMGTTFLGCVVTPKNLMWISVGDSPFYHFRKGKLKRLNADHSLAPLLDERARKGDLTVAEAMAHPDRHVLQSACLGLPLTIVDSRLDPFPLEKGDILIAASDGILTLKDQQMEELLSFGNTSTAGKIADTLMFAVRCADHPRQDNTTVAVVKVP